MMAGGRRPLDDQDPDLETSPPVARTAENHEVTGIEVMTGFTVAATNHPGTKIITAEVVGVVIGNFSCILYIWLITNIVVLLPSNIRYRIATPQCELECH